MAERVPGQSEPGDVGAGTDTPRSSGGVPRRVAIEAAHRGNRRRQLRLTRPLKLAGGGEDAGAERLGQQQGVAGARAGVRQHARGIDHSGHRVAELDLGVAARYGRRARDPGLGQLVVAATEDLAE